MPRAVAAATSTLSMPTAKLAIALSCGDASSRAASMRSASMHTSASHAAARSTSSSRAIGTERSLASTSRPARSSTPMPHSGIFIVTSTR
jgi:hypothetical protein